MFSAGNRHRILEPELSPKVDETWIRANPTHASLMRDVLHHHHIDHG